jgi:imidazolonepropionase-like amidohydrolase
VIHAATAVNAAIVGMPQVGTIKPGEQADLLVLDANPLQDIKNTEAIAAVIQKGKQVGTARKELRSTR